MKKQRQINYNAHPFRVFMSFFRPHMGLFVLDMACAMTASVIDLVFPYVSRLSMTELLPNRLFETFFIVMGIMFLAYVLKGVMYIYSNGAEISDKGDFAFADFLNRAVISDQLFSGRYIRTKVTWP